MLSILHFDVQFSLETTSSKTRISSVDDDPPLQVRPGDQFVRSKSSSDGCASQCKQCQRSAAVAAPRRTVTLATVEQQQCGKCGEVRDASYFHRNIRYSSGLDSRCVDCEEVTQVPSLC
jgi:hypothetical protein